MMLSRLKQLITGEVDAPLEVPIPPGTTFPTNTHPTHREKTLKKALKWLGPRWVFHPLYKGRSKLVRDKRYVAVRVARVAKHSGVSK